MDRWKPNSLQLIERSWSLYVYVSLNQQSFHPILYPRADPLQTSGTCSPCLGLDQALFPAKVTHSIRFQNKLLPQGYLHDVLSQTVFSSIALLSQFVTPSPIFCINLSSSFTKRDYHASCPRANLGDEVRKSLLRPGANFSRFVASPQLPYWDSIHSHWTSPFFFYRY